MMVPLGTPAPPTAEEVAKRLEDEYYYLQRQYRLMETDAAAFAKESMSMIAKQEVLIDKLEATKFDVMTQVTVAQNPLNANIDNRNAETITRLLQEGDTIDARIKKERVYIAEVEAEIRKTEKLVKNLRAHDLSDYQIDERDMKSRRRVLVLDARLSNAANRFNETLAQNARLREQISHYLFERTTFNKSFNRLIVRLSEGRKVMLDLIELASVTYDQREEAMGMLNTLETRGLADQKLQTHEMSQLSRRVDREVTLREFVAAKGQRRVLVDFERRTRDKYLKERDRLERLARKYRDILADIRGFSGEDDVEKIARAFADQENTNFMVYTYAIELNREVERLREHVDRIETAVRDERANEQRRRAQRNDMLARLRADLRARRREAGDAQKGAHASREHLDKVLGMLAVIFKEMECDNSEMLHRLGDQSQPTEYNFPPHLTILERRAVEMMCKVRYLEQTYMGFQLPLGVRIVSRAPFAKFEAQPLERLVETHPCAICVETLELSQLEELVLVEPLDSAHVRKRLDHERLQPEFRDRLHNLSACRLPRSRKILQRRYM